MTSSLKTKWQRLKKSDNKYGIYSLIYGVLSIVIFPIILLLAIIISPFPLGLFYVLLASPLLVVAFSVVAIIFSYKQMKQKSTWQSILGFILSIIGIFLLIIMVTAFTGRIASHPF